MQLLLTLRQLDPVQSAKFEAHATAVPVEEHLKCVDALAVGTSTVGSKTASICRASCGVSVG